MADTSGASEGLKTFFAATSSEPRVDFEETDDFLNETVAGMRTVTVSYMKGVVTGLLKKLYDRNSRRDFLPFDQWLIEGFNMGSFVNQVVIEQLNQDYKSDEDHGPIDSMTDTSFDNDEDEEEEAQLVGTSRFQQLRRMEHLRRLQYQKARRRKQEQIAPRLEILQSMPFFIPFSIRVEIFREFVRLDKLKRRNGLLDPDQWRLSMMGRNSFIDEQLLSKHHAKVRRSYVFDDAYEQLFQLGDGLKEPLQITFVDQFDTTEAGIDGGGVTKEFLTSITNEAFACSSSLDLFSENAQHLLYPNPIVIDERKDFLHEVGFKEHSPEWNEPLRDMLRRYEFLGRVVGKCLYEGILVDIHFASFFLAKWALTGGSGHATNESSYRADINELRDLDDELYQGLLKLKNYPGDVEDFALDFTITDVIPTPGDKRKTITRDLRRGGSNMAVTNSNRLVYISDVAKYRLQTQSRPQTEAFLRGLGSMVEPSWLSMFNQTELQTLLGGDASEIDVADLRRNTLYGGVYVIGDDGQEHPTVRAFWAVMLELSDIDRRKVLKYVTSTPRGPLLGFSQLNPPFSIRDSGSEQSRLPSTSTCVNLLKLPIYATREKLRERLLYAINSGAGFNLS